jgi:hypothetical protein
MANSNSNLMQSTARSSPDYPAAFDGDTLKIAVGPDVLVARRNTRRSAMNIAMWWSYLPSDCIKTMIKMGWDRTT